MHAIKVFREEVHSGERGCDKSSARDLNRYANNIQERPYLADDIAAFKTLLGEKVSLPRVIFLSINLLEGCDEILEKCTHLVFDESGKTPTHESLYVVTRMSLLRKVIFTGDPQQLGPYVSYVPPFIVRFGFQSM